jgi:hypothetical protein
LCFFIPTVYNSLQSCKFISLFKTINIITDKANINISWTRQWFSTSTRIPNNITWIQHTITAGHQQLYWHGPHLMASWLVIFRADFTYIFEDIKGMAGHNEQTAVYVHISLLIFVYMMWYGLNINSTEGVPSPNNSGYVTTRQWLYHGLHYQVRFQAFVNVNV